MTIVRAFSTKLALGPLYIMCHQPMHDWRCSRVLHFRPFQPNYFAELAETASTVCLK